MALPPSSLWRRAAAMLAAALLASASPAIAPAQEADWAPLPRTAASRLESPSLAAPLMASRTRAPANGPVREFDLPAPEPPMAPAEIDWTLPGVAPGRTDEFGADSPTAGSPPAARLVGGQVVAQHWTSPFTQPARTPWLAQPLSFSKFAGGYGVNEPIEDRLGTGIGLITGIRTCWDFAPRWGVESRLAWARTSLGSPAPGELVSHENFWFWDAEFVFYPWPDTLWRPFIFAGTGMTDVMYIDQQGRSLHQSLFHVPFGIGVKRQVYGEHAFRIDVSDNLLFTDMRPREYLHGLTFAAGFELRFGGRWKWLNSLPLH